MPYVNPAQLGSAYFQPLVQRVLPIVPMMLQAERMKEAEKLGNMKWALEAPLRQAQANKAQAEADQATAAMAWLKGGVPAGGEANTRVDDYFKHKLLGQTPRQPNLPTYEDSQLIQSWKERNTGKEMTGTDFLNEKARRAKESAETKREIIVNNPMPVQPAQPQWIGTAEDGVTAVSYNPNTKQYELPDGSVYKGQLRPKPSAWSPDVLAGEGFQSLSPEQKEFWFQQYTTTGNMPPFAYRDIGSRNAFIKDIADYQAQKGSTGAETRTGIEQFKALSGSLRNQQKIRNMMGSFVSNINKQIDRVDQIYQDMVSRVGIRALDMPMRELKTRVIGSGNEQAVTSYLLEISNEIGKLSTGSAASIRELSVDAQKQWAKVHDPNLSIIELKKVLDETKNQANMRLESTDEEIERTINQMEGGKPKKEPETKPQSAKPNKWGKYSTDKKMTTEIAKQYLMQSGGDKEAAREAARRDGYTW